jgi:hypothetical protein
MKSNDVWNTIARLLVSSVFENVALNLRVLKASKLDLPLS